MNLRDFCRRLDLTGEDISQLEELERQLPLIAQLTGDDIFIDCFDNQGRTALVVAQAAPDRSRVSAYGKDVRGKTALREMEREVAHSRHLNAIGSLAAGVAHEIRNPLSSIKGFAVYFKQRLAGNAEDEETAQIMIAETDRLNRVISQLIEFARPLQLKKERTCLAELARQTVRLVEAEAAKQTVAVDVRVREPLPDVEVDPDKIKQVLLNLLLNALAAMPGGGKLTVDLAAQGSFLDVAVSDTGEGIRAEDLPRIYDPYFTSKPAGTGLGLAVVQKIMDAHGGRIFVESTRGAGTTVTLRFVLMSDDQGEK